MLQETVGWGSRVVGQEWCHMRGEFHLLQLPLGFPYLYDLLSFGLFQPLLFCEECLFLCFEPLFPSL